MEKLGIDFQFWKDRKVFITGHTGFKGGWLSLWLQILGAEVTGYSLPAPSNPNLFELAQVGSGMQSLQGDIRDYSALRRCMQSANPEIIFHLAAQSLVKRSYQEPLETLETNIMGTAHVLEAARHFHAIKAIVIITSDKCYHNDESGVPHREDFPMGGKDPYSSSKGAAELITAAYRSSFFARHACVATARAGNVIGGGDFADNRLIPDMIRAFVSGKTLRIRYPHAIRPWQHVLDPLRGYLMLAQKLMAGDSQFCGGWNFGPLEEDARPVSWVVERAARLWDHAVSWELDHELHLPEAQSLRLDCSQARRQLLWSPRWELAVALERTFAWYRAWMQGRDLRSLTLAQIDAYCTM